ncbi:MAG: type II secretion system F family protein [Nitriliruptoraceae bacterium]
MRGLTPTPRLRGSADPDQALDELHLAVVAGAPVGQMDALPARVQRVVSLAQEVGAPLGPALEAARAARDDVRRAERAVAVASAQTRVVAGGLLAAPLVLVPGLARLVDADLVGFYTTPLGSLVLAVGLGLLAVGALLVVVLVRRVGRTPPAGARRRDPVAFAAAAVTALVAGRLLGWLLALPAALLVEHLVASRRRAPEAPQGVDEIADLVATALAAGVSGAEALRLAAERLPQHAIRLRRLAFGLELGMGADDLQPSPPVRPARGTPVGDPLHRLAALLATADRTGAPVAASLRHLAAQCRADDLARVLAAAERLPAQLTFPTALCLLPATVLLIGAPIVQTGVEVVGR